MTTTDLEVKGEPRPTIVQFVQSYAPQIREALPAHITTDRFLRLLLNEMRKTPDLQRCTPESVIGAMLTASSLGLEFGPNGECYMLPFENKRYDREARSEIKVMEAEFVPGYKGIAKLFWQHPLASRLSAEYVCERDHFEWDKGLHPFLHHKAAEGDRGKVIAYYAIVGLRGREPWFDVFTPDQIKALRNGAVGPKGKIKDPEHWMERKTALLQVLKLAPKSSEVQAVLAVDERSGADLWHQKAPAAIAQGDPVPTMAMMRPEYSSQREPEDYYDIDEVTGEVLGEHEPMAPAPTPRQAPAAAHAAPRQQAAQEEPAKGGAEPIKKVTGVAVLREFARCGVEAAEVPAWLGLLGVPYNQLADMPQAEAVELLESLKGLDRDGLANLGRQARGDSL